MPEEYLAFDVKTGMKNIIGRDLITDDFIAIYELVKNSYDAYADYVTITFLPDEIIIADNGKGMSGDDLRDKWFAVAYSAKWDGSEDGDSREGTHLNNLKSRRFYAGAKGVGRFSCDRLGNKLVLKSRKVNSGHTWKVQVDWEAFQQDAKQSFGDIKVPMSTNTEPITFPKQKPHGTILHISLLNSTWTEPKLVELKRSLEKLINPFSKDNDFKVEIIADAFIDSDINKQASQRVNGVINNSILKVLDIKTTQINVRVKDGTITTKLVDRGNLIYNIEEANINKDLIDDLDISLYFLNRSAKVNFGKIMDIEPVNYGNVFLFKNGFRVQPYGNVGDDSWGLDKNKTQGYGRYLGTRELFGKVDLTTEKFGEFKEVSSRAGGLVETRGKKVLFDLFDDKALKRLERYVSGVLWGEAFKRKNYFIDESTAEEIRKSLKDDKDKDNYEDIKDNIGSKIDFVNLIKSLSDEKDIKIIEYNKELVNLVNEHLAIVQPKFMADLERIAEKTNDSDLLDQIKLTEENFQRLIREKEAAEQRELEERNKRLLAEERALAEEERRKEAEKKAFEEQLRRKEAELQTEKKERERVQAENDRLKAEKRAADEAEQRKLEQERNKTLNEKLSIESQKNQYLNATRKTLSDDAEQLVHSIDLYVGNASSYINTLLRSNDLDKNTMRDLYQIKMNIDKALKVSSIIIKSNFDYKHVSQRVNLPKYIYEYLSDLGISRKDLTITTEYNFDHYSYLNPIEIDIILDNLVSNSLKAKAHNVLVSFEKPSPKDLVVHYFDDGKGVPERLVNNPVSIFELGVRESTEKGSGIGMYDVKKRMENLKGDIKFIGNNQKLVGAAFTLTFHN
jgi:signal transduction histidine kinase